MATAGKKLAFEKDAPAYTPSKKVPRIAFALAAGSLIMATSGEAKGVNQKGPGLLWDNRSQISDRSDTRSPFEDLLSPSRHGTTGRTPQNRSPICFNSGNSLVGIFPNRGYDVVPSLFWKQEKKREIVCTPSMAHILTDYRLIQVPLDDSRFSSGLFMFDTLEKIYELGLVSWAQSDTADFLITDNARLSIIRPDKLSKTYILPTGIDKPKMTTHGGFVFISNGLGGLIIMDDKMLHVVVPIVCDPAGDFFTIGSDLYFGRQVAQGCSISVRGNDVTGIKVEKK